MKINNVTVNGFKKASEFTHQHDGQGMQLVLNYKTGNIECYLTEEPVSEDKMSVDLVYHRCNENEMTIECCHWGKSIARIKRDIDYAVFCRNNTCRFEHLDLTDYASEFGVEY